MIRSQYRSHRTLHRSGVWGDSLIESEHLLSPACDPCFTGRTGAPDPSAQASAWRAGTVAFPLASLLLGGRPKPRASVRIEEAQRLPRRTVGSRRVRWAPANYPAVHDFLTNPAYAGAFVFGRTHQQKSLDEHGQVRCRTVELPVEQWSVCLPEHHPGYVSWDEYLATRERLRANVRPRGQGGGAAREGGGLLQGILRCGRCGRRMQVAYSGNDGRTPRYACVRANNFHGGQRCQSLGGLRLEKAIAAAFLEAITASSAVRWSGRWRKPSASPSASSASLPNSNTAGQSRSRAPSAKHSRAWAANSHVYGRLRRQLRVIARNCCEPSSARSSSP